MIFHWFFVVRWSNPQKVGQRRSWVGQPSAVQSTWAGVGSLRHPSRLVGNFRERNTGGGGGERPLLRSRELQLFCYVRWLFQTWSGHYVLWELESGYTGYIYFQTLLKKGWTLGEVRQDLSFRGFWGDSFLWSSADGRNYSFTSLGWVGDPPPTTLVDSVGRPNLPSGVVYACRWGGRPEAICGSKPTRKRVWVAKMAGDSTLPREKLCSWFAIRDCDSALLWLGSEAGFWKKGMIFGQWVYGKVSWQDLLWIGMGTEW